MELYLPPDNAKLHQGNEFKECSSTFRKNSQASRKKANKYWSDSEHHRRVSKTAIAVDVYDSEGHYLATYPSARKCAEAMFPDKIRASAERQIRACRQGHKQGYRKLQYLGYQFKPAKAEKTDIKPTPKRLHKAAGYHINRSSHTFDYCRKKATATKDDTTVTYDSVSDLAHGLGVTRAMVYWAVLHDRQVKGWTISYSIKSKFLKQWKNLKKE